MSNRFQASSTTRKDRSDGGVADRAELGQSPRQRQRQIEPDAETEPEARAEIEAGADRAQRRHGDNGKGKQGNGNRQMGKCKGNIAMPRDFEDGLGLFAFHLRLYCVQKDEWANPDASADVDGQGDYDC